MCDNSKSNVTFVSGWVEMGSGQNAASDGKIPPPGSPLQSILFCCERNNKGERKIERKAFLLFYGFLCALVCINIQDFEKT